MSTLLFVKVTQENNKRVSTIYILSFISIFLSASGTGIISYVLFFLFSRKVSNTFKYLMLLIFIILLIIFLPLISGRFDIWDSLFERMEIIYNSINFSNLFLSDRFGIGTNALVKFTDEFSVNSDAIIADSMLSSSLINLGLIFLIIFIYEFLIKPIFKLKNLSNYLLYIATFAPFFLTTVLFEVFPINLLFFISFYYIHNKKL